MLSKERLENIHQMEEIANQTEAFISEAELLLEKWSALLPKIQKMEDYYASRLWREDYEASNSGQIPENMPHGVLSQDWLYNLLGEHTQLCKDYKSLIDNYLGEK